MGAAGIVVLGECARRHHRRRDKQQPTAGHLPRSNRNCPQPPPTSGKDPMGGWINSELLNDTEQLYVRPVGGRCLWIGPSHSSGTRYILAACRLARTLHSRFGDPRAFAVGSKSLVFQHTFTPRIVRRSPDRRRGRQHRQQILHSAGRNYISREAGLPGGGLGAVAIGAFRRRLLVNDVRLAVYFARLLVAILTTHICVPSLKRKFCPHIMIKSRRHPALRGVTISARRFPCRRKLPGVRILVAVFANPRRAFELRRVGAGGDLVAGPAGHGAMRAKQRKIRFRVVKPVHVRPRRHAMTGFAS